MTFVELAQECAPAIAVNDLAAIVQVQSNFDPYVIRTNSGKTLKVQPKSLAEAVKTATALTAAGEDIEMGLSGVTIDALNATGKGIGDAFDPCQNLAITAQLLTIYQARVTNRADTLALFYGRGDLQSGKLAGYNKVIDTVSVQLAGKLNTLQLKPGAGNVLPVREWTGAPVTVASAIDNATTAKQKTVSEKNPPATWDVFNQSRSRAKVFFQER